jgi:hypothetical protein
MVRARSTSVPRQPTAELRLHVVTKCSIGLGLAAVVMIAAMATAHAFAQPPRLIAIVPNSGPIGTQVTIQGSGFTDSGNTVIFGVGSRAYSSGSVYPNHSSDNGSVIIFTIPEHYDPACEYSSSPCPYAALPTVPGTYGVAVSNVNGQSNTQNFTVIAQ